MTKMAMPTVRMSERDDKILLSLSLFHLLTSQLWHDVLLALDLNLWIYTRSLHAFVRTKFSLAKGLTGMNNEWILFHNQFHESCLYVCRVCAHSCIYQAFVYRNLRKSISLDVYHFFKTICHPWSLPFKRFQESSMTRMSCISLCLTPPSAHCGLDTAPCHMVCLVAYDLTNKGQGTSTGDLSSLRSLKSNIPNLEKSKSGILSVGRKF